MVPACAAAPSAERVLDALMLLACHADGAVGAVTAGIHIGRPLRRGRRVAEPAGLPPLPLRDASPWHGSDGYPGASP